MNEKLIAGDISTPVLRIPHLSYITNISPMSALNPHTCSNNTNARDMAKWVAGTLAQLDARTDGI
jgi:hypothetical protein